MRRHIAAVLVMLGLVVLTAGPAAADNPGPIAGGTVGPGGVGSSAGNGSGGPVQTGTGTGGNGGPSACPQGYTYSPTQFDSNLGEPYPGAPGQAIDVYCGGTYVNTVWQGPAGPPAVNPAQLAQQALASAPFNPLVVVMSPPSGREAVNFPVFLSLGAGYAPVSASASAGGVTSTVSAVPGTVTWSMGDGHSVTCRGPGVAFDPSRSFASQLPAPCGYSYQKSSANQPGQVFLVTATVHFTATWSVTGAAGGGALPPVDRSVTLPVTVGEIQIVNS